MAHFKTNAVTVNMNNLKKVAIVPTTLEQKLFGTSIQYGDNYISVEAESDTAEFFGPRASRYSYSAELRNRISEIAQSKLRGTTNRYWVLDGSVCVAAQSSIEGAMHYMNPSRVLVFCA